MAYTLKTTGIATKLLACIAVDEDGTTVKDFVSGNTGTYNASIAAPKTGTATWKGVTRSWFKTDYGADVYAPQGYAWSSAELLPFNGNGASFFTAVNAKTDAGAGVIMYTADNNNGVRVDGTSHLEILAGASVRGAGTTALPTATKFSCGVNQKYNTTGLNFFYGLESGSLATDGSYNEGGYGGDSNLAMFGGGSSQGSHRGQYFIMAVFTDATLLTTAEMQSLHDDWFNTLFEAPITGTFAATLAPIVMAASGSHGVPQKQLLFSAATSNLLKDDNQSLVTATGVGFAWYDSTNVTGLGTVKDVGTFNINSGVASITLTNTLLVGGQTGTLMIKLNTAKAYIEMAIT